jgi:hypothetical protein
MSETYPILIVSPDSPIDDEALGSKPKFWFRRDGQHWLFKEARENTGEDWAEKVAAEIAHRLDISAAEVELAEYKGRRGSALRSFVATKRGEELIHGNEILAGQVLGYDPNKRFRQNDHTLENIHKAIGKMFPSPATNLVILRQLASYLVLDALIGNTDRHHENWGLLFHFETQKEEMVISLRVAPSFDHASSLGRELNDAGRTRMLAENRVSRYVRKGRGGVYLSETDGHGANPLALVEFGVRHFPQYFSPPLENLHRLTLQALQETVDRMPAERMTEPAKAFARAMLAYTYECLCNLK